MIRKLAPYTKGYRVYILLGILCSAGEAVLELMLPKAMSNIVDYGIGGNGGARRPHLHPYHGPEDGADGPDLPGVGRGRSGAGR